MENTNDRGDQADRYHAILQLVFIVLIIGCLIASFIAWLVVRPQHPEFQVDSFSISNFTVRNDSKVSFAGDVRLTARNPDKKQAIKFGRVDAGVFYKSWSLAVTAMPPFSLGKKGQAHLNASFAAVAGSLVERDSVGFDLKLSSSVRFETSWWGRGRNDFLKLVCGDLLVGFPRKPGGVGGGLIGGPRPCNGKVRD